MGILPTLSRKKIFSIIIVLSCLGLTSCSFVGIGYKYADWLIKRRIMEVIKFYSPQQERLEKILDDYMAWHKEKMLPLYLKEVRRVASRVEKFKDAKGPEENISAEEVHTFLLNTRKLYLDSFIPLSHRVSPLLSELGEEQLERSRTLINRKMDELKERAELSKEDFREEMKETWEDNLEDWYGELSETQKKLLNENLDSLLSSPKVRFARGGRRTQEFFAVFEDTPLSKEDLKEKDNATKVYEKRTKALKEFFNHWSEKRPYDKWRKNIASFMAKFLATLSAEQKLFFYNKIKGWEKSLEELVEVKS